LVLVAGVFAYYILSKNPSHQRLYPFIIYGFSISILYQSSLISNTIFPFGSDISLEYLIAKTTQLNSHWSLLNPFPGDIVIGRVSSMLSVSVLPTAYSNLLNFDLVWVFKLIYPLLFAFVPVGLYYLWKGYIGEKYSFVSSFFFISFSVFFYLLYKLIGYDKFGANLRYAIPTVTVLWNDVEILAKWGMPKEPWVHINWKIMSVIIAGFAISTYLIVKDLRRKKEGMIETKDIV